MKDTVTNKTLTVWSGFQGAVARYLSQRAATAQEAVGGAYASPSLQTHVEGLHKLRKHIETIDPADQSLWQLREIQGMVGGDTDDFNPGPSQENFFAQFGMSVDKAPPAPDALAELVSCGIEDYKARQSRLGTRLEHAEARADRVPELETKIAELQEELDNTRAELVAAKADAEQASRNADYLRKLVSSPEEANGTPPEPDAQSPRAKASGSVPNPKPRRRRAKTEHPGVYQTERADGTTVYEVKVTGQPWRTVGTNLDEAINAREELTSTPAAAA
jgi:uncharacterized small protein (DUF1192 family)